MRNLNILIPADFSEVSELAFEMADIIAQRIPVNIHLLHVIEVSSDVLANDPGQSEAVDLATFYQGKQNAMAYFSKLRKAVRVFRNILKLVY